MSAFISNNIDVCQIKNNLSKDILNTVFNKFNEIYYRKKYENLLLVLNNDNSQRLRIIDILPHIDEILNNKNYITYLQKNDSIFKNIYESHYVYKSKSFVNLKMKDSLALSWLMYLHH